MSYKFRMADELAELEGRIAGLARFLGGDTFKTLSPRKRYLMREQHACMMAYRDTLAQRLELEQ